MGEIIRLGLHGPCGRVSSSITALLYCDFGQVVWPFGLSSRKEQTSPEKEGQSHPLVTILVIPALALTGGLLVLNTNNTEHQSQEKPSEKLLETSFN